MVSPDLQLETWSPEGTAACLGLHSKAWAEARSKRQLQAPPLKYLPGSGAESLPSHMLSNGGAVPKGLYSKAHLFGEDWPTEMRLASPSILKFHGVANREAGELMPALEDPGDIQGRGNRSLQAPHPHHPRGLRPVSFAHQIPYEEMGSPSEQPVLEGRGAKGTPIANWNLILGRLLKTRMPFDQQFHIKKSVLCAQSHINKVFTGTSL